MLTLKAQLRRGTRYIILSHIHYSGTTQSIRNYRPTLVDFFTAYHPQTITSPPPDIKWKNYSPPHLFLGGRRSPSKSFIEQYEAEHPNPRTEEIKEACSTPYLKGLRLLQKDSRDRNPEETLYIIEKAFETIPNFVPRLGEKRLIELPYHAACKDIRIEENTFRSVYDRIWEIYKVVRTAPPSPLYFRRRIWLCYHANQVNVLEDLIKDHLYELDPASIAYAVSSYIVQHRIQEAKILFQRAIISTNYNLPEVLFRTILFEMISHQSLFENLQYILNVWINSPRCEPLSAKSWAMLLREYYKYGTPLELSEIKRLIKKLGYSDHYLILSASYEWEVIRPRRPFSLTAEITKDDLDNIESFAPTEIKDLEEFYITWMYFFSRKMDMNLIQYILKQVKSKIGKIEPIFFEMVMDYFSRIGNFRDLKDFLQATMPLFPYRTRYLRPILLSMAKDYPKHAEQFSKELKGLVVESSSRESMKELLNISSYNSRYHVERSYNKRNLDADRYHKKFWRRIIWNGKVDHKEFMDQVKFRVHTGFIFLVSEGFRPNYQLFHETIPFCTEEQCMIINDLLRKCRLDNEQNMTNLELKILYKNRNNIGKEGFRTYFNEHKDRLTVRQIFSFWLQLTELHMHKEAEYLLDSIEEFDLNDSVQILRFYRRMLTYLYTQQYDKMEQAMENFPIDTITIKPILPQLLTKISHELKSAETRRYHNKERLLQIKNQFTSFFKEVNDRLNEDDVNIPKEIVEFVKLLRNWKANN